MSDNFLVKVKYQGTSLNGEVSAITILEVKSGNKTSAEVPIRTKDMLESKPLRNLLIDNGMPAAEGVGGKWKRTHERLIKSDLDNLMVLDRPGFHQSNYVDTSQNAFGLAHKKRMYISGDRVERLHEYSQGEFQEWSDNVARYAKYSSRLTLALCAGFSGFTSELLGVESGGIHFYGNSSIGKSTCLRVVASIFGPKKRVNSWFATETGVEEMCFSHNNSTLILDEFKLLDRDPKIAAQKATAITYLISEGGAKKRARSYSDSSSSWNLSLVSAGELSLGEGAVSGGTKRLPGEGVRFLDIPAQSSEEHGIFDCLPKGYNSSASLVEKISRGTEKYFGTARFKFLTSLCDQLKNDKRKLIGEMKSDMKFFLEKANPNTGCERRAAKRFALQYASGSLAAKFKVLPFSKKEILDQILKVYMDYKNAIPVSESEVLEGKIRNLKKAIKSAKTVVVDKVRDVEKRKDMFEKGVILLKHTRKGRAVILVSKVFFDNAVGGKGDSASILKKLAAGDILIKSSDGKNSLNVPAKFKKIDPALKCFCFDRENLA
ncbi:DUF927 domain-containing protein [Agaribacterium sp. ZY112]|uniref:DUF927 domain-containing protein n=1 Tax=Agaribacterium sp. ZY112 TaxID=3233574 RepID=UPI003524A2E3